MGGRSNASSRLAAPVWASRRSSCAVVAPDHRKDASSYQAADLDDAVAAVAGGLAGAGGAWRPWLRPSRGRAESRCLGGVDALGVDWTHSAGPLPPACPVQVGPGCGAPRSVSAAAPRRFI